MDIREQIADLATPGAATAGLVVDDVTVESRGRTSVVHVVVDLPADQVGAASIDAISQASRAISAALDEADAIPDAYTLEVSTPGTDRPLTEPHHFKRARTRLVTLTLSDGGTVKGRITDADDSSVTLDEDQTVELNRIDHGLVELEFKRPK